MQVASFVTFAVQIALGGELRLSAVFYIVALLNLPKLWLALFFVKGVKSTSETRVAASRINAFLCQLEPHTPVEEACMGAHLSVVRYYRLFEVVDAANLGRMLWPVQSLELWGVSTCCL